MATTLGIAGATSPGQPNVRAGFCSERGRRPDNQDYCGLWLGDPVRGDRHGMIAAIADGVGGAKGGRVAAELAVRGLLEGLLGQSETLAVQRAAARAIEATNGWLHAVGRTDAALAGMACTLTALVLRGRRLHVLHVGDTRLYRLRGGVLDRLTTDHTPGAPGTSHMLTRAVGPAETVRLDYAEEAAQPHDRYLLCSDGVHGELPDRRILVELARRAAPHETARRLVEAALASSAGDNATALVLDVLDLPTPDQADLQAAAAALPVLPAPRRGATVDDFVLDEMLVDGRYSRVFRGRDTAAEGRPVVLKFPKPGAAAEASFRQAFLRESWIAARVRSPFVGEVLELPAGRQSCLYSAMPLYQGETLERRILRGPPVSLEAGVVIAAKLGKALGALHRAGVIHRDIKPDNVILEPGGGLRLIDLGVARLPNLEDFAAPDIPGTPSYMAPELHAGQAGDERSDLYALGVTLYRLFGGGYPYGEVEPFSHPRFKAPESLLTRRRDLPAWLDQVLARSVAVAPEHRFADANELVAELEIGMARGAPQKPGPRSLHDRNPLLFWRITAGLLALMLLASLASK
ncbi:bifunctional protein-serine/threonine kinase/phosphatase [Belnapia sp. T18]|uniref:Bifunctional protein-serine/threonine kinase/phosphatase n=1 Tax=Belnapia arida TaxID=2804533 RepID=A0ABS1U9G1_9PROT|nr:bifunctional protein-serine/threonine kinase/phosphatase [Belnapia arida]MBL6081323.1 bifunctional protein-serine/threonine kinase/phosphatase [Belnapia arida]